MPLLQAFHFPICKGGGRPDTDFQIVLLQTQGISASQLPFPLGREISKFIYFI